MSTVVNPPRVKTNEWLRGEVIQVQNSIVVRLCHFGKARYIENNILKYLSHSSKNSGLIDQHNFSHFQNFRQWESDPSPSVYIGTF